MCFPLAWGQHVIPIEDERPHQPSEGCACCPTLDPTGEPGWEPIWLHHAWDRREVLERVGSE